MNENKDQIIKQNYATTSLNKDGTINIALAKDDFARLVVDTFASVPYDASVPSDASISLKKLNCPPYAILCSHCHNIFEQGTNPMEKITNPEDVLRLIENGSLTEQDMYNALNQHSAEMNSIRVKSAIQNIRNPAK